MKRKKPSFNETYYGFRTFSHLLEDAQRKGVVSLRRDAKSGSYVVEDLGAPTVAARAEGANAAAAATVAVRLSEVSPSTSVMPALPPAGATSDAPETNGRSPRRRRGGRGRRRELPPGATPAEVTEAAAAAALEDESDDEADDELAAKEAAAATEGTAADAGSAHSHESAPPPASTSEAARERSPFSFFSWLRRDETDDSKGRD